MGRGQFAAFLSFLGFSVLLYAGPAFAGQTSSAAHASLPALPPNSRVAPFSPTGAPFTSAQSPSSLGFPVDGDPTIACRNWNTKAFFQYASASTVAHCLALGVVDVLSRDPHGNTPLHWAAWTTEDLNVIPVLLRAGGHLRARNRHGLEPLQIAAAHHHDPAVLTALVNAGADPGTLTADGRTTLHLAAQSTTNPAMIDTLMSLGLNLMEQDDNGNTATTLAAQNTTPGVFDALVSAHRGLFRPRVFDVTPFRDENRVFFNVADKFPTRKEAHQYHYSWCQYPEHRDFLSFLLSDPPRVGECDATDGVEGGKDPILLEAQIGGDVALGHQSAVRALAFLVEQLPPGGQRRSTWQLYATMVLRLRMMRAASMPILPPSFMPKVTYQRLGFRKDGPTTATMHATHVAFGHHSNGQTGCPFLGQPRRPGDGECLELAPGAPVGDVNYATGNFSTHYFRSASTGAGSSLRRRRCCHRPARPLASALNNTCLARAARTS